MVSTKILAASYMDNNKECYFTILEWFLMDVILKTWVMAAENSALHHRNKLHFKIHKSTFEVDQNLSSMLS